MNPFSQYLKKQQQRNQSDRAKLKLKYFGQYQPQLYIASRSKSKSKSNPKTDLHKLNIKTKEYNQNSLNTQTTVTSKYANSINPQIYKSPAKTFNTSNLSDFLLSRSSSSKARKQQSAIQKVIVWVEKRYYRNTNSVLSGNKYSSSFSILQNSEIQKQRKFEETIKKITYDLHILKRLKKVGKNNGYSSKYATSVYNFSNSKEHAIDQIQVSPQNKQSKNGKNEYNFLSSNSNFNKITQGDFQQNSKKQGLFPISEISQENNNFSDLNTFNKKYQLPLKYRKENEQPSQTNNNMENSIDNSLNLRSPIMDFNNKNLYYKQLETNFNKESNSFNQSQNMRSHQQANKDIISLKNITQTAKHVTLFIIHDIKHETALCDLDYYPNALFHPQNINKSTLLSLQYDKVNSETQNSDQILNQIFQTNDQQQQILSVLKNKNMNSIIEEKNESKISQKSSKIKKTAASNYFLEHLLVDQKKQIPQQNSHDFVYEMPLSRANNQIFINQRKITEVKFLPSQKKALPIKIQPNSYINKNLLTSPTNNAKKSQIFTFNSLNNYQREEKNMIDSSHIPNQGNNAFIKVTNAFTDCCGLLGTKNSTQISRANYFKEKQIPGRQRITSCNSNQSKTSSKPKVNFNYVSPSQKNVVPQEEQSNSVLLKSQSSHLKNSGNAPVKIQIRNSRKQNKQQKMSKQIQDTNNKLTLAQQKSIIDKILMNNQLKSQTTTEQKIRSYSVPKLILQSTNEIPHQKPIQSRYQTVKVQRPVNAFVIQPQQYAYQSQKLINSKSPNSKASNLISNRPTIDSYYFSHLLVSPSSNSLNRFNNLQNVQSVPSFPNNNSATSIFNKHYETLKKDFKDNVAHQLNQQGNHQKIQEVSKNQNAVQYTSSNYQNLNHIPKVNPYLPVTNPVSQHILLYPLKIESKQKQIRNKRARSLNEKILVTVKNKLH